MVFLSLSLQKCHLELEQKFSPTVHWNESELAIHKVHVCQWEVTESLSHQRSQEIALKATLFPRVRVLAHHTADPERQKTSSRASFRLFTPTKFFHESCSNITMLRITNFGVPLGPGGRVWTRNRQEGEFTEGFCFVLSFSITNNPLFQHFFGLCRYSVLLYY